MVLADTASLLDVLVGLHSQDAVHDLVAVQVLDGALSRLGFVVFHNSSGQSPTEVVLLNVAFLHGTLSGKQFLTPTIST